MVAPSTLARARVSSRDLLILAGLTAAALLLHGYHYGVHDQGTYLTAIKKQLDPSLYPRDSAWLRETGAGIMLFDEMVAWVVRLSCLPLDAVVFIGHAAAMFLLLLGCWRLARRCHATRAGGWTSVAMVVLLLPLQVAQTRISLMEQYFHPRELAACAMLFAFVAALDGRRSAIGWVAAGALMHPMMAAWGSLHVVWQAWRRPRWMRWYLALPVVGALAVVAWTAPANDPRVVVSLSINREYFPLRWPWHGWLEAGVALFVLAWLAIERSPAAGSERDERRARVSARLFLTGACGIGIAILLTGADPRLALSQPMRSLHLVFLVAILLAGGGVAERWLAGHSLRRVVVFAVLCALGVASQRRFPSSPWIEWPGRLPANGWVEAFDWVRTSTPRNALFALDPWYLSRLSDGHSFRALAERDALPDASRGPAILSGSPAYLRWTEQIRDQEGWRGFRVEDFRRLRDRYAVGWVIVQQPGVAGLVCPYANAVARVCRIEGQRTDALSHFP
jgi:hypothetical protein